MDVKVPEGLDNLEKRLDQQYKTFIDKLEFKNSTGENEHKQIVDQLQQSFMENFDRMLSMNKSLIESINNNNEILFNSFNKILKQMEELIRQSTPRLIPSPS